MKKVPVLLFLACVLLAAPAAAQEPAIADSDTKLICDAGQVIDCGPEGECSAGSPESVDMPRFIVLDLEANEMSSPSPGFEGEATPLGSVDRSEGVISVSGRGRGDRVFALRISRSDGAMRASVLAGDFAFLAFGACVATEG